IIGALPTCATETARMALPRWIARPGSKRRNRKTSDGCHWFRPGLETLEYRCLLTSGLMRAPAGLVAMVLPPDDSEIHVNGLDITAVEGKSFTGVVATFTSGDEFDADQFHAKITWGDGQSSTGQVTETEEGHFNVTGTNTYCGEGDYVTTVIVTAF